jgi:peptide chain release factor 1
MVKELPPLIHKKLETLRDRSAELEELIATPEVLAHSQTLLAHSRELGSLRRSVMGLQEYLDLRREIADNDAIARDSSEDPELRALAKEGIQELSARLEALVEDLVDAILVDDKNAAKNVIMEIRAGTGGDEAGLFVADLFRMYRMFAEKKGWKIELIDSAPTNLKGYKEIVFSVTGDSVNRDLRYEMGGHRVQRVPETESSGRIHTSAATVAVMAEAEEVDVEVKESDLEWEFCRASGPGGQKVNKTSSAVRMKHVPTGLVVRIQDESSQHKNRAKALKVLRARILESRERESRQKEQNIRRSQIGSGERNQRIRTYNFPQNRVTDHRIGENYNLDKVLLEGDLTAVLESLRGHDREEQLKSL